jgi:hypothetical protein
MASDLGPVSRRPAALQGLITLVVAVLVFDVCTFGIAFFQRSTPDISWGTTALWIALGSACVFPVFYWVYSVPQHRLRGVFLGVCILALLLATQAWLGRSRERPAIQAVSAEPAAQLSSDDEPFDARGLLETSRASRQRVESIRSSLESQAEASGPAGAKARVTSRAWSPFLDAYERLDDELDSHLELVIKFQGAKTRAVLDERIASADAISQRITETRAAIAQVSDRARAAATEEGFHAEFVATRFKESGQEVSAFLDELEPYMKGVREGYQLMRDCGHWENGVFNGMQSPEDEARLRRSMGVGGASSSGQRR